MLTQEEVDKLVEAIRTSKVKLDKDQLWVLLCNAGDTRLRIRGDQPGGSAAGVLLLRPPEAADQAVDERTKGAASEEAKRG